MGSMCVCAGGIRAVNRGSTKLRCGAIGGPRGAPHGHAQAAFCRTARSSSRSRIASHSSSSSSSRPSSRTYARAPPPVQVLLADDRCASRPATMPRGPAARAVPCALKKTASGACRCGRRSRLTGFSVFRSAEWGKPQSELASPRSRHFNTYIAWASIVYSFAPPGANRPILSAKPCLKRCSKLGVISFLS